MMSYINTLHVSSVRCGFLSSGENDSNTLKTAEKKISVLKDFRKRVSKALDFAKERRLFTFSLKIAIFPINQSLN